MATRDGRHEPWTGPRRGLAGAPGAAESAGCCRERWALERWVPQRWPSTACSGPQQPAGGSSAAGASHCRSFCSWWSGKLAGKPGYCHRPARLGSGSDGLASLLVSTECFTAIKTLASGFRSFCRFCPQDATVVGGGGKLGTPSRQERCAVGPAVEQFAEHSKLHPFSLCLAGETLEVGVIL
jgi:hypothetical protein